MARLGYAFRVASSTPAKSNISLDRVRIPDKDITIATDRYLTNAEMACHYTEMLGATYLNFLQPFNGHGRKKLSRFDVRSVAHVRRDIDSLGENHLDMIIRFMDRLWEAIRSTDHSYDLRSIFDDFDGEIYLDHVHVSDIGQDMIAKQISEVILSTEGKHREQVRR